MYKRYTVCDRLQQILEAIDIIEERCKDIRCAEEFLLTPGGMMIFDSCVMRLQAIGEQVGKLLKAPEAPLHGYESIPWRAIYDMRNLISHEYMNIDESIVFSTIKEDLPAIRPVIDRTACVVRILPQIDSADLRQIPFRRPPDDALSERPRKHLRKQRYDVDLHPRFRFQSRTSTETRLRCLPAAPLTSARIAMMVFPRLPTILPMSSPRQEIRIEHPSSFSSLWMRTSSG